MNGSFSSNLESVAELFGALLQDDPTYSAQLCVFVNGHMALDIWGGPHMGADTLTGLFSVSKGIGGIMFADLVQDGLVDLETPVAYYWPEFATSGKDKVTVSQLLSHQAGVPGVPRLWVDESYDSEEIARRLALMPPLWKPGSAFGYHSIAIGPLMEELYRRITGITLQQAYEVRLRKPIGADLYLGLPDKEEARFQPNLPPLAAPGGNEMETFSEPRPLADSIEDLSFNLGGPSQSSEFKPNLPHIRRSGSVSIGAVGSARGLAEMYARAFTGVTGELSSESLLSPETVDRVGMQQAWGVDRIIGQMGCFATVFQKPFPGRDFGSFRALGHDGYAGSLGFADPMYGIAFGYVQPRVQLPGGLDHRALLLSRALRRSLDSGAQ